MISFCLPKEHFPDQAWIEAWERNGILPLEEKGKEATAQCWIYQTWALLIGAQFPCHLLTDLPSEGIVLAMSGSFPSIFFHLHEEKKVHGNFLRKFFPRVPSHFFLVDIVADGLPHPAANLHLVQNSAHAKRLPRALFMPHWPQPQLIPRDPARGARFETISFFGDRNNLASELCCSAWQERLQRELGIHFEIRSAERWHDYSDIDGVIAIRDFSTAAHWHKPATKLYNAWLAGVPFIGGRDSSYASDGRAGHNYLVATSPEELFQHLKKLKENVAFRAELIEQGKKASTAYTREATLNRWKILLQTTLPGQARQWQQTSAVKRALFFFTQRVCCFFDRLLR